MTSQTERERQEILERLNNLGRTLEQRSLADASELNIKLRQVVEWLAAKLQAHK